MTVVDMLANTPYLIPDGTDSEIEFEKTAERSAAVAERAREAQQRIALDATELLQPFLHAQRSDLVAESNRIEGYDVTRQQVLEAVATHRELLDGAVHGLMEAMRADPKIVNALGLYKAQEIADGWAHSGQRPRAYEMRQLHALLTVDDNIGGRYRDHDVKILGQALQPPQHFKVPSAMDEFADWWLSSTGDPVLDATIAHAWLTHIHPYLDGNGRLARVLANFALAQSDYPPLVVKASSDRGEYYSALAASDEGNILPLYRLFAQIIRRTVRTMSRPGYTQDFLQDRLLSSVDDQRSAFSALLTSFERQLGKAVEPWGWAVDHQGIPSRESFQLLCARSSLGNGWFLIVRDPRGVGEWLLWFGYTSDDMSDLLDRDQAGYPSVFVSRRDDRADAPHPFAWQPVTGVPDEIYFRPLDPAPIFLRDGYRCDSHTVQAGAKRLGEALLAAT